MAATELHLSFQENPEVTDSEPKTIFNILSKIKESDVKYQPVNETVRHQADEDILILRKDPETNQSTINKSAYLKLHRSLSPNRNTSVAKIKGKYERSDDETTLSENKPNSALTKEIIESLKYKYSPAGVGYTQPQPLPKPRRSKLSKSQILTQPNKEAPNKARLSLNIEKNKHKDVNSNHLQKWQENLSSEDDDEFVTIVTRSDSEESVLKFQKELAVFTMDKKKRANSFRRIFSVFSNKDKKKKQEEKNKSLNKENGESYSDNFQNESNSFSRQTPYRHTTGSDLKSAKKNVNIVQRSDSDVKVPKKYNEEQLEEDYAKMHINQYNRYRQSFQNHQEIRTDSTNKVTPVGYTPMDKPLYKSNESSNSYMNVPNIQKYIDTSSSTSTVESDRFNVYQNEVLQTSRSRDEVEVRAYPVNSFRPSQINDGRRDTPPRLFETKQDVRLVNPKALIPINSERPLPNPYQNGNKETAVYPVSRSQPLSHSTPTNGQKTSGTEQLRPHFNDTYGTVFDSIEKATQKSSRSSNNDDLSSRESEKGPRPPSVEPTKLRLPPNREIIPLSPRMRSPIPPDNISTEKIIATELLKFKRSPTPTKKGGKEEVPSHQKLEIDIDYPDNINNSASQDNLLRSEDAVVSKPPISNKMLPRKLPESSRTSLYDISRMSQASRSSNESVVLKRLSQASPIDASDRIVANAQVHANSPVNTTPTPNRSLSNINLALSPMRHNTIRPTTPIDCVIKESPKTTPQKQDMRKSVEAYYWKEIKKLKDQENYELYMYQMQYGHMIPYGWAEDPISVRRSRSISPSASRNGRRSLSLPRETKPVPEKRYPNAIPENRAVTSQMLQPRSVQQLQFQQQQYFQRNSPARSTVDGSPRKSDSNTNSLYRPIFKRGSLSSPPAQLGEDSLKRKVSFSGAQDQNVQSWPTKNGYTQSPPQRRIEKLQSQGDDEVFLPNESRHRLPHEEIYYNTRQHVIGPSANGEPAYASRATPNSLYFHQRQPIESHYGQIVKEDSYGQRVKENPYGQKIMANLSQQRGVLNAQEDVLYGQPLDAVRPQTLTRHGSIQMQEGLYSQRLGTRRMSYQNNQMVRPSVPSTSVPMRQEVQYVSRRPTSQGGAQSMRREIIVNDEIFGQFGGYAGPSSNVRVVQPQNVYASGQSIAEYNSRIRDEHYNRQSMKQVSVTNRVCDIYGQIHDSDPQKVQQSGVLMGQLHHNPGSPGVLRNSYNQLAGRDYFVRNSRLTASANDMYRRVPQLPQSYPNESLYGKIEQTQVHSVNGAPNRPLPPLPLQKGPVKGQIKGVVRNNLISDTESCSDASEVQRILNSSSKSKKRGLFGKRAAV